MATEKSGKINYFGAYKWGGRFRVEDYEKEFIIDSRRENYNALYSLAMAAAANRLRIKVIAEDLTAEGIHPVNSLHAYW
jgi:hypothetical protein